VRFLILSADYSGFQHWLYTQHPRLEERSYKEQMRIRTESLFGDLYHCIDNLEKLGHEASGLCVNNEYMQKAWAREHGLRLSGDWRWAFRLRRGIVPWLSRVKARRWFYDILAAQIKYYKPDVLLNQAMDAISTRFLQEMKPYVRVLVGQIAAPIPPGERWGVHDMVLSSLPNVVAYFRSTGVPSELNRLAFDPAVLSRLPPGEPELDVSFVGSFHPAHDTRIAWLEHLCSRLEMKVWANGVERLRHDSPIRSRYVGTAWGVEMYQIFHTSKMTLNHHIEIAGPYANNLRLYEATGVGTLLLTDWKENLHEIFIPGKEVVAYRSPEECAELIHYYLTHEEERQAIAAAGQQRTLREHTSYQRMQELVDIVPRYLEWRAER
jgi:spore maturation protein CgeB